MPTHQQQVKKAEPAVKPASVALSASRSETTAPLVAPHSSAGVPVSIRQAVDTTALAQSHAQLLKHGGMNQEGVEQAVAGRAERDKAPTTYHQLLFSLKAAERSSGDLRERHLADVRKHSAAWYNKHGGATAAQSSKGVYRRGEAARKARSDALLGLEHRLFRDAADRRQIQDLYRDQVLDKQVYHGTNSHVLTSIAGNPEPELMSAAKMERLDIHRRSGEGEHSSADSGAKPFVSVGAGNQGLGTALAYAEAPNKYSQYNLELLKSGELDSHIRALETAVGTTGGSSTVGKDTFEIGTNMRAALGAAELERTYIDANGEEAMVFQKKDGQYQTKLKELQAERARRTREGPSSPPHSVLFGFDWDHIGKKTGAFHHLTPVGVAEKEGLDGPRHQGGLGGALAGEAHVADSIDLTSGLARAFVPHEHKQSTESTFAAMPIAHKPEVLSLESMDALPDDSEVQRVQHATDATMKLQDGDSQADIESAISVAPALAALGQQQNIKAWEKIHQEVHADSKMRKTIR